MRLLKKYIWIGAAALTTASCSDFLDTAPYDALSPSTTWQSEDDAEKFAIGCYDGWESGEVILYMDCGSDFGYNNFSHEGFKLIGNGSMTAADPGYSFYDFTTIRRCNTFLENIDAIEFDDEAEKKDLIAQVRTIRAYRYFVMNWLYGGVPIIDNYTTAEEAQVPRDSEEDVRTFIENELDTYTGDLNKEPSERGRFAQGTALAIRMREALYYEDWATAIDRAKKIIDLGIYELEDNYEDLFNVSGKDSKEIITAVQYVLNTKDLYTIGQMYNNAEGGWSSIVPTQNLVDTYEMSDGLTIDESTAYDPAHPFNNRDPRMAMSILYPGCNYTKSDGSTAIFNTLDKEDGNNDNYYLAADNASKTALTWAKYLEPITQYSNIWGTDACPIVFRYAEVLLTYAEAENELNGPSSTVYNLINQVRNRAGMPDVDETKYSTQETLRELIRRERAVEFAGEGLRRADILRWKTSDGKMLAETVLNGRLERIVGTVSSDTNVTEGLRATIDTNASDADKLVEERTFKTTNRYLPIPQTSIDSNPQLTQNEGY